MKKRSRHKKNIPTTARAVALGCLLKVEEGRFPEEILEELGGKLTRRDRALASALVYGVLRWRSRLEWLMGRYLSRPDKPLPAVVRLIIDLGLFQLFHLDRIPLPPRSMNRLPWPKPMPRPGPRGWSTPSCGRPRAPQNRPTQTRKTCPRRKKLALAESHPAWLVSRWVDMLGPEEAEELLKANNTEAPLALRVNTARATREEVASLFQENKLDVRPAAYSPEGLLIHGRTGPVTELPGYNEGLFAVQDEAAQLVGFLSRAEDGARILDACAGRGGKALHLAGSTRTEVWGLDTDAGRLGRIPTEAARLGLTSVHQVRGDLARPPFRPDSFDLVLVDAPCSNLGVIRRRPDVKWLKTSRDPARMARTQLEMLAASAALVRPGGRLVYSVCTLTPEETTGVIAAFGRDRPEFGLQPASRYLPPDALALVCPDGALRAWPHKHGTDGFFAAVFEREKAKPPVI